MKRSIIILHGWGRGAKSYFDVKTLLEKKGYSVYVFDLPGFGEADPPLHPWTISDYTNFIFNFVRSQGLDKFYLSGHSFGGRIAIKFAAKYPENLAALILCDAAGIKHPLSFRQKLARILAKIGNFIFKLPILNLLAEFARKVLYRLAGSYDYRLARRVMRETLEKVLDEDLTPYLAQIKKPTLIVWGRNDKTAPLSDAYIMHKQITGSELKIIENVGHRPHVESPDVLARMIDEFVNKINQ